jgi:hypothetical protein
MIKSVALPLGVILLMSSCATKEILPPIYKDTNGDGKIDLVYGGRSFSCGGYYYADEDFDGLFESEQTTGVGVSTSKIKPGYTLDKLREVVVEREGHRH